jgi:hypothetical protein
MKAQFINEFHQTGDPLQKLDLGGFNLNDVTSQYKKNLNEQIENLKTEYYIRLTEELEDLLVGKTVTAYVEELFVIDKKTDNIEKKKRINGKHTFKIIALRLDEQFFDRDYVRAIIVSDENKVLYNMNYDQKIFIK